MRQMRNRAGGVSVIEQHLSEPGFCIGEFQIDMGVSRYFGTHLVDLSQGLRQVFRSLAAHSHRGFGRTKRHKSFIASLCRVYARRKLRNQLRCQCA